MNRARANSRSVSAPKASDPMRSSDPTGSREVSEVLIERINTWFIEELTMRDADFLVDEFDRVDCGVDTAIEIECPDCYGLQEIELPFDQGFFMPGKGRTARRRGHTNSSRR